MDHVRRRDSFQGARRYPWVTWRRPAAAPLSLGHLAPRHRRAAAAPPPRGECDCAGHAIPLKYRFATNGSHQSGGQAGRAGLALSPRAGARQHERHGRTGGRRCAGPPPRRHEVSATAPDTPCRPWAHTRRRTAALPRRRPSHRRPPCSGTYGARSCSSRASEGTKSRCWLSTLDHSPFARSMARRSSPATRRCRATYARPPKSQHGSWPNPRRRHASSPRMRAGRIACAWPCAMAASSTTMTATSPQRGPPASTRFAGSSGTHVQCEWV